MFKRLKEDQLIEYPPKDSEEVTDDHDKPQDKD
jgi:hypothetical protein